MEIEEERLAAKRWMRGLREARGYTQAELAALAGTSTRTVLNLEAAGSSFPNGWTMLRLLQELGAVADAPAAPPDGLDARLQSLEEQVARGFEKNVRALGRLANRIDRLGQQELPRSAAEGGR